MDQNIHLSKKRHRNYGWKVEAGEPFWWTIFSLFSKIIWFIIPIVKFDQKTPIFQSLIQMLLMQNRPKIDNRVQFLFSMILEFLIIQQIKWVSAYRKMILTWSEEILSKIFLIMAHENANICSMSITQPSEISKILKFHKNSCKIFITKKYNYETRFCSFKKHRNFSLNSLTHKP